MAKKINSVLKKALVQIKPSEEEIKKINHALREFLKKLEARKKTMATDADIFIGGSFARNTMMKKPYYDIDIFIRFDKRYRGERLSEITGKILQGAGAERIHGSRDYFKVRASGKNLFFEIVPVKRIKNTKEAENITDLSYSHVNYIKKKFKGNRKLLDEVLLAKAFCQANNCYGAESHIRGFSGYGLELLIYHYGSFAKFLKEMIKLDIKNKLVIDIEKHHKGRHRVLLDLNEAKLQSPIILIDPTFKQRNVLAALSEETFFEFEKSAKAFLRNPSLEEFNIKSIDVKKVKSRAKRAGYETIVIEARTNKQPGDIAGSKLLKFYKLLEREILKFFEIKKSNFEYGKDKKAMYVFSGKRKGEIIVHGPHVSHKKHSERFRKKHKKVFIKDRRLHARLKTKTSLRKFVQDWKAKPANRKRMKEMYITGLDVAD